MELDNNHTPAAHLTVSGVLFPINRMFKKATPFDVSVQFEDFYFLRSERSRECGL